MGGDHESGRIVISVGTDGSLPAEGPMESATRIVPRQSQAYSPLRLKVWPG